MIKPLPGYVLIEPIENESKTGEIYLPETSKDKPSKGKVVDFCFFRKTEGNYPIQWYEDKDVTKLIEAGQTVFYKKWTNEEVEHQGKKYLFVKFDELLGVEE